MHKHTHTYLREHCPVSRKRRISSPPLPLGKTQLAPRARPLFAQVQTDCTLPVSHPGARCPHFQGEPCSAHTQGRSSVQQSNLHVGTCDATPHQQAARTINNTTRLVAGRFFLLLAPRGATIFPERAPVRFVRRADVMPVSCLPRPTCAAEQFRTDTPRSMRRVCPSHYLCLSCTPSLP